MLTCPACGYVSIMGELYGSYAICPVCKWEDDGANANLILCQQLAMSRSSTTHARDPHWRPLDGAEVAAYTAESALQSYPHRAISLPSDAYWASPKGFVGVDTDGQTSGDGASVHFPVGCALFSDVVYQKRADLLPPTSYGGLAVAWWSFFFLMAILIPACHGLLAKSSGLLSLALTTPQYVLLGGGVIFMLVVEGYLGFHCSWSPATARRALIFPHGLASERCCSRVVLTLCAPLFAGGFVYASCKRLVVSYILPPAGLCTGTLSFAWFFLSALWTGKLPPDVDAGKVGESRTPLLDTVETI